MSKIYPDSNISQVTLDEKDKQILEFLYKNSRTPFTEIARKTGIPKDSVLYRVKRMEKLGVVHFTAILDPVRMGFPIYKFVNFTLHNFEPAEEKKLIAYCEADKYIVYIAKTSGKYDYSIAIAARNLIHYDEILKKLRSKFNTLIKEFEAYDIIQQYKYDYLMDLIE